LLTRRPRTPGRRGSHTLGAACTSACVHAAACRARRRAHASGALHARMSQSCAALSAMRCPPQLPARAPLTLAKKKDCESVKKTALPHLCGAPCRRATGSTLSPWTPAGSTRAAGDGPGLRWRWTCLRPGSTSCAMPRKRPCARASSGRCVAHLTIVKLRVAERAAQKEVVSPASSTHCVLYMLLSTANK